MLVWILVMIIIV